MKARWKDERRHLTDESACWALANKNKMIKELFAEVNII